MHNYFTEFGNVGRSRPLRTYLHQIRDVHKNAWLKVPRLHGYSSRARLSWSGGGGKKFVGSVTRRGPWSLLTPVGRQA